MESNIMGLNIAIIGCGMIGRARIERSQNRIKAAKSVAVCDVFEGGRGDRGRRHEDLLPRSTGLTFSPGR